MSDILSELLPRKARLVLYVIVFLAGTVLAIWQASEGDWVVFSGALATALTSLLAAGNVNPPAEQPVDETSLFEYGLTQVPDASLLSEAHFRGLIAGPAADDTRAVG